MTRSDRPTPVDAITAADEAHLWDRAAEDALDEAARIAATRGDATEYALIGIGLALRAANARLDALTGEVSILADALADRLTSRKTGRDAQTAHAVYPDDSPDDVEADNDVEGAAAPPPTGGGATVTPLRRTGARP